MPGCHLLKAAAEVPDLCTQGFIEATHRSISLVPALKTSQSPEKDANRAIVLLLGLLVNNPTPI